MYRTANWKIIYTVHSVYTVDCRAPVASNRPLFTCDEITKSSAVMCPIRFCFRVRRLKRSEILAQLTESIGVFKWRLASPAGAIGPDIESRVESRIVTGRLPVVSMSGQQKAHVPLPGTSTVPAASQRFSQGTGVYYAHSNVIVIWLQRTGWLTNCLFWVN